MCCDNRKGSSHVGDCLVFTHFFDEKVLTWPTEYFMVLRHLKPLQVLVLDEITVDLDVVTRMDLLDFFKEECEQVKFGYVISSCLPCLSGRIT
jgi:hypothetical protein